ncbi:MAG: LexA family transcriptional regulator [Clostridiales bacterium]|nr:LexA family transcriptional regulator [Clostridiales bacterium]
MSRLGDTIRAARLKAGMSARALGKKCGVAESFIAEVEGGTRIVSDEQAQRLLKALGVANPVSTELEVAAEPERPLRPKPRPYVVPLPEPEAAPQVQSNEAWLDALGGVVKRVPVIDDMGTAIDHILVPIVGGKIEGGPPDKVLFYRMDDDSLRGFRVHAGDLLLVVPAAAPMDDAIMLLLIDGRRLVRKVKKVDGLKLIAQSYDRDFEARQYDLKSIQILGRCVRLERQL